LSQCDIVGVSNSTFSFSACMLNRTGRRFERTTPSGEFVEFDPWNAKPLLHTSNDRIMKTPGDMMRLLKLGESPAGVYRSLLVDFPRLIVWSACMRMWMGFLSRGLLGVVMSVLALALGRRAWRDTPSADEDYFRGSLLPPRSSSSASPMSIRPLRQSV